MYVPYCLSLSSFLLTTAKCILNNFYMGGAKHIPKKGFWLNLKVTTDTNSPHHTDKKSIRVTPKLPRPISKLVH